jgi:membrane-bound lytic murein transglycosylase A
VPSLVGPPSSIPGFAASSAALEAFRRACPKLRTARDRSGLTRPEDWAAPCADKDESPTAFFDRHFAAVRLGSGEGFTTGYYEPEIAASRTPLPGSAPVLRRPPALLDVDLGRFQPDFEGRTVRGMVKGSRLVPAPTRAEIEAGALAGQGLEIAYARAPVDLFFLHIQGSGLLRFDDGTVLRVGYAGQNGHAYVPIGRLLKQRSGMAKVGMVEIRSWIAANPQAGAALMRENPSYIFLQPLPASLDGPLGTLGVALAAEANVAVDPALIPLGAPVWLETEVEGQAFRRMVVAADTGGAIKGANRFDIFFGAGADAARKAGALAAPARAMLLIPRPAAERLPRP